MPTVNFIQEVMKNASESRERRSQAAATPVWRVGSPCRPLMKSIADELEYALPLEVVLDFSGVTFMDSSGIAVALHTLQQVKRLGGKMWIANPSQQAKKVFFAAGIQRMIGMEDAYEK